MSTLPARHWRWTEAMGSWDRIRSWIQRHGDAWALVVLLAVTAGYAVARVDFRGPPFEDAAMLMRYAENLAAGHGIVWNIGEAPVDGATDFLFMTTVAGLIRLGFSTGRAVRFLGLGGHVLTVLLVYLANRKLWKGGVLISLLAGSYLAVGTGLWYVAAYFGTPFFAFFVSVMWVLALMLIQADSPSFLG